MIVSAVSAKTMGIHPDFYSVQPSQAAPRGTNPHAFGAKGWKYLDPSAVAHLKSLEFIARTIVEGYFVGKHRSPYRGDSAEFDDYRPYCEGDELRRIDWKVFARTDRHYIKLYREETNLLTYVMLDKSNSMFYRGEDGLSKLDYACYLIAALSYLLIRRGDKVGLTLFDDRVRWSKRPGGTMPHLYSLLSALEETSPDGSTDLAETLNECFPLLSRRGVLVVVSDFLEEPAKVFETLYRFRHKRFDITLFHILHPHELDLPAEAGLRFVDSESRHSVAVDCRLLRRAYRDRMTRHLEEMQRYAQVHSVDYNVVTAETPYQEALEQYLQRRKALSARR
jgi:uncharacterized protein (DUF58 family)